MRTNKLLDRIERLDHHERLNDLIAHARGLAPADADALVRKLFAGDTQARLLALHVMLVRRDAQGAASALSDPSLSVRGLAAKLVGRHATALPTTVLDALDASTLARLLGQLVRRGRNDLARGAAQLGRLREDRDLDVRTSARETWLARA